MPTGTSGHKGRLTLGDISLRVHRYTVTWSAPEEPLPVVPSWGRAQPFGWMMGLAPPPPDNVIDNDIWASGYVLGPPRFEALLECYYLPDDNPFFKGRIGKRTVAIGSVAALYLEPDYQYVFYAVNTNLLISKVEMTGGVRSLVSYNIGGVGLRFATYPVPND